MRKINCHKLNGDCEMLTCERDIGSSTNNSFSDIPIGRRTICFYFQENQRNFVFFTHAQSDSLRLFNHFNVRTTFFFVCFVLFLFCLFVCLFVCFFFCLLLLSRGKADDLTYI